MGGIVAGPSKGVGNPQPACFHQLRTMHTSETTPINWAPKVSRFPRLPRSILYTEAIEPDKLPLPITAIPGFSK